MNLVWNENSREDYIFWQETDKNLPNVSTVLSRTPCASRQKALVNRSLSNINSPAVGADELIANIAWYITLTKVRS